jgi:CysZ protein
MLGRGAGLLIRRKRMFVYGAIPPLITSLLFTGILVGLVTELDPLVGWLTPFANGWSQGLAALVRALVGVALLAGAVLLMVITFSTLTLALGSPLYDKISESVDRELAAGQPSRPVEYTPPPPVPVADQPTGRLHAGSTARSLGRSLRQSAALIGISMLVSPLLFLAGFLPVVGQTVVPVVSAVFGGWMLAIELIGSSFERNGQLRLKDRRLAMRRRRATVLGLGIPSFLLLAIPFAAVLVFPVATAAGTILARDLLGGPDRTTVKPNV